MIINGLRWIIKFVPPSDPILETPWRTRAFGVCDKLTQIIYIDNTLSHSETKTVLSHELVHAIIFSYRVNLSYDEEEMIAGLVK